MAGKKLKQFEQSRFVCLTFLFRYSTFVWSIQNIKGIDYKTKKLVKHFSFEDNFELKTQKRNPRMLHPTKAVSSTCLRDSDK